MTRLPEELLQRLARLASSEGVELLDVEVAGAHPRAIVRLVIDRPDGGVTLADCEAVSRQASVLLDGFDPFPGRYSLEVTSPGLDRRLYRDEDYRRFTGQRVKVRMQASRAGSRTLDGTLEGREGAAVLLRQGEAVVALPLAEVREVRLQPFTDDEQRPARPGKRNTR